MKTDLFQSCGNSWVLQTYCHMSTFTASSFRIWNSSTGIPSPPLALFVWCFLRPTWLHIPGCLVLGEWSHHHDLLGYEDLFVYCFSVYYCHLFLICSAFVNEVSEIAQLCLTLCNPMDYTVHGILQARILEWIAFPFSSHPNPGIEPRSSSLQADCLPAETQGRLSASVRSISFLPFIVFIFAWNIPLISPIFLRKRLLFPIVFLYFFALSF